MAELRTEEEQIAAIKNWWKENGRSTVLGIVLAVTAVVSWQYWQHFKQTNAEQASALYQNFIASAATQAGQPLSDENRKSAEHLAKQLKEEFSGSVYAQYVSLWLAKSSVEQGDYSTAKTELNWVLEQEPDAGTKAVVDLRMARILLQEESYDQALSFVADTSSENFKSQYLEVKGDILAAKGDTAGAHKAYQAAIDAVETPRLNPILEMKRDNYAAEGQ